MPTTQRLDTVLFTFQVDITTSTTFVVLSNANPTIPTALIEYYNRRCSMQLCAELYNFDCVLVALDTQPDPQPMLVNDVDYPQPDTVNNQQPQQPRRVLCTCSNPNQVIKRITSDPVEVSSLWRNGQDQVFGIMGRRIREDLYPLVRNVTLIAYLGQLVASPQPTLRTMHVGQVTWPPP